MMREYLAVVSVVCVAAACGREAQARTDTSAPESRVVRMSDAAIASTLDAINRGEIAASKLASAKASDPAVRAFAAQLVRDHEAMQQASAHDGSRKGERSVDAVAIDARGKALLDTLAVLSGRDFDLTYMDAQVNDHQMVLQAFHAWQTYADGDAMRTELRKARPMVQSHYDQAQALLPGLMPAGESSVWKKHLGMPVQSSGKP